MRKYSSKLARKLLVGKIISDCEHLRKFDVRASFGEECDFYDEKKDVFIYRGKNSDTFIGMVKGICFEYKGETIYCFAPDNKFPDSIGAFRASTNGKYSDVSNDTRYFDSSSRRGKELLKMCNRINDIKNRFVTKVDTNKR